MPARKVVVDIETIPCPDSLRPLLPKPRPPANPGLWGRMRKLFSRSRDDQEDAYQQSALNWTFGRIICIGLLIERENQPPETRAFLARISPGDAPSASVAKEAELLQAFWEFVTPDDYFIGHNILGFDLPFLWNRSIVCNVRPSRPLHLNRESVEYTFDTMQVWGHWPTSGRQYVGLGTLTNIMGLPAKTGSGSRVYDLWREQRFEDIRDYCLNDVKIEYELYRRLTLGGGAPAVQWKDRAPES